MLYLTPYQGSQFYLNATQMFAIIASALALLLIPFMCFFAIKFYFSPLSDRNSYHGENSKRPAGLKTAGNTVYP